MTPRQEKRVSTSPDTGGVVISIAPSGPRNARIDPETGLRKYTWQGVEYPSVTSLRSMAGMSFALHNWALSRVVTRATEDISGLNTILAEGGPDAIKEAKRWLRAAATEERDRAADLGTRAHDACASGKEPGEVAADVAPFVRQFRNWIDDEGIEIIAMEKQVWNLTLGYAGTFDLLCRRRDGKVYLVDLKTGKGTYPEHALQAVAYAMADFIGEDDVIDQTMTDLLMAVDGLSILHLVPTLKNKVIVGCDGWEEHILKSDRDLFSAFRGLLTFAKWLDSKPNIDAVTEDTRRGKA